MKLRIKLADFEETQCMKDQELVLVDKLLNALLKGPFDYPKFCIKRTDELNVVELGDFATAKADKLDNPVEYGRTLLNLTFGYNWNLEIV